MAEVAKSHQIIKCCPAIVISISLVKIDHLHKNNIIYRRAVRMILQIKYLKYPATRMHFANKDPVR